MKWKKADIVVNNGQIVALDTMNRFKAKMKRMAGKYVVPGLIDGHIHIESSMLTPAEFSRILIPHGITTVITDPHEIANVAGAEGIQFMLEDAKKQIWISLLCCHLVFRALILNMPGQR